MYQLSVTVESCLRAGTRVDIAWVVSSTAGPVDSTRAVALTAGGGKVGSVLGDVLDARLGEHAGKDDGRLVHLVVDEVEATMAEVAPGTYDLLLVSAAAMPSRVWELVGDHRPVALRVGLEEDRVTEVDLAAGDESPQVATMLENGASGSVVEPESVVTLWNPVARLVVLGDGPMAEAVGAAGTLAGWHAQVVAEPSSAALLAETLGPADSIVVSGHDVERTAPVLDAALRGGAGYIGSLGSRAMQQARADWLAGLGVDDLSRVHGPAGLDLGAEGPGQVGISVVAEAIRAHRTQ